MGALDLSVWNIGEGFLGRGGFWWFLLLLFRGFRDKIRKKKKKKKNLLLGAGKGDFAPSLLAGGGEAHF